MSTAAPPAGRATPLTVTFWILCVMEMWERLAYYGVRLVLPIYIAQADEPGGLHFTQLQKGNIIFWWAMFQSVLPTFTGGISDRYGYKKTMFWAITLKVIGYVLMATQRDYWGFFVGCMTLATGTAIFKPGIQGSLAQNLDKSNASFGWGVFYWLVNVGSFTGAFFAKWLYGYGWNVVFYGCAAIVALNYAMMFMYREVPSGADTNAKFSTVAAETFKNLLEPRLLVLLLILAGFWLMMYQLWDAQPNFIVDWVDSSAIAAHLPASFSESTDRGMQVAQQLLLNINAGLIILFLIPVSIWVARVSTLRAMLIGTGIATIGVVVAGVSENGWMLIFGVCFFSAGEMLTGPKKLEYMGHIAPPGKKGLYLGYVNIPVGVGQGVGGLLTGWLYGTWGEKAVVAQKYLAEKTTYLADKGRPAWDGALGTLETTLGVPRAQAYETLRTHLGKSGAETTQILWDTYSPWVIWLPIAGIGVLSGIGLWVFAHRAKRWKDMNH